MDLPHPYHTFKFPQTVQICAQENKPKPAQGAADGKVTRVWPQRAEVWQAQSLTHLCKGKPSRDQGVSISSKVNKLFRLLKTLPLLLASGTVLHFCKEDKVKIGHLENQEGKKRSAVLKKDIVMTISMLSQSSDVFVHPENESYIPICLLKCDFWLIRIF